MKNNAKIDTAMITYYCEHTSPIGILLIAATDAGVSGIYFEEHKHFKGKEGWTHAPTHMHLQKTVRQLDEYFAGTRQQFDVSLAMHGTEFQQAVWQALCEIDFGELSTYSKQAIRIGKANAVRAVGTATGRNPVSIIVPCHRVVGMSGALTGYAGGLKRKQFLLMHEQKYASSQQNFSLSA